MPAKQDPNLGLNYGWDLGEANWKAGMDANLKKLGAVVGLSVLSRTAPAPAVTTNGARYIVPATGATGDFAGQANKVAVRVENTWEFYTPGNGWLAKDIEADEWVEYKTGLGWVTLVIDADPAGTAASAVSAHEAATDPHPQYTTAAEAAAAAPVQSVNGKDGAVVLTAEDVGADPTGTAAQAVADHEAKGPLAHALATVEASGFMSAADKVKVDALKSAANENVGTDPLDLPRNLRLGTAAFVDWDQLVTRGSNENGEWVRYPDGTQICWLSSSVTGSGTTFNGTANYPIPFVSSPKAIPAIAARYPGGGAAQTNILMAVFPINASSGASLLNYRVVSSVSETANTKFDVTVIAIGRWK